MTRQSAQAAEQMDLLERDDAQREQHGVEAGGVVALGGEVEIASAVRALPARSSFRYSHETMSRLLKLLPMCPERARAIM